MARTALPADKLIATGVAATYVTPDAAGVSFRNTKRCVLHVKNASGGSINVTPKIGRQVLGQSGTSPATGVAAGAGKVFAPFGDDYEQPGSNDHVVVDLSAVSSVTVALLQLPA